MPEHHSARQSSGTRYSCASQSCFNETIPRATGIRQRIISESTCWSQGERSRCFSLTPATRRRVACGSNAVGEMSFLLADFRGHRAPEQVRAHHHEQKAHHRLRQRGQRAWNSLKRRAQPCGATPRRAPDPGQHQAEIRTVKLDALDHLVLKLEYEASRLRK